MTSKDWILLLVPIVLNGTLLFIAQNMISRKFKKNEIIDARIRSVVDKFLDKLYECIDVVSETERKFKFRDDMKDISEEFKNTISEFVSYGKNMNFVMSMSDELEKIRAKSGYCLTQLIEYQKLGNEKSFDYPMDEQLKILSYLSEIKTDLQKLSKKCIKK